MRDFFKGIWFKILLGIVAVLLGFLLYEGSTGQLSPPSQLLGIIVQPFQRAASWVASSVSGTLDPFIHAFSYKTENEKLKQQVNDLQNQLVDYNNIKEQNEQFKEIAGIKSNNSSFDMIPATVISRDSGDPNVSFTINMGSLQGVKKNDPVITSAGLVGIVSDVSMTFSQVTTLLSPEINVGANDSQTGEYGIVSGDFSLSQQGLCIMQHLGKNTEVKEGGLIVTSGGSGLLPSNLVIGTVKEIKIDGSGLSSNAVIQPSESLTTVSDVLVVRNFEGKA